MMDYDFINLLLTPEVPFGTDENHFSGMLQLLNHYEKISVGQ